MVAPLRDMTLAGAADALAARRVSAVELAEAAIAAHAVWQPHINAFLALEAEDLLAAARASDARRAAGRGLGPLDGVPLALKDMFDRSGRAPSGGTILLADRRPTRAATVVERLQAAGGALAGPLNMAEWVASPSGHNIHYGPVRNPWDPSRTAAGSSGGSGAAVAAGIVLGAIGSDTGGSIRLPASVAGVVGLKPTYGRVSRAGSVPRAPSLDTIGPLARTAEDCALLLDALQGPDRRDPTTWSAPDRPALAAIAGHGGPVRLATCREAPFDACEPSVARAWEEALDTFARLFGPIGDATSPDMEALYALADTVAKSEAATLHARYMREHRDAYSPFVYKRTEVGFHLPTPRYVEALSLRGPALSRFLAETLAGADVLVLPVMPIAVPTLAETAAERPEDIVRVLGRMTAFTRPFNYLGLPGLSLPIGFDEAGLPVGVQLVGRPFSEPLLLGVAHRLERETGHWTARPQPPQDRSARDGDRP